MVAGLVEVMTLLKNRADIATIVREVGMESGLVMEILVACEALGLARIEEGDAVLTEQGISFSRRRFSGKIKMLRELLKNVEPFKSILEYMSRRREPITIHELCNDLKLCGEDPDSITRVKSFILEWLVPTGYLAYDGGQEMFKFKRGARLADK